MQQDGEVDDPSAPSFLLKNLEIATSDCFADSTHNSAARHAAAQLIAAQVGFYVGCLLRGFESRAIPAPPAIIVVGSGFIGSNVLTLLMENGCSPFLHVYCRGDLQAQQWRRRGLKSSPSMPRLMKEAGRADIVILCTGLSGFSNTAKVLLPYISHATCVITSSFGLQRKRIYAALGTVGVFRAYLEPQALIKQVKSSARAAGIDHRSFDDPAMQIPLPEDKSGVPSSPSGGGGGTDADYDDESVFLDDASMTETIEDSIKTYKSTEQFLYLSGAAMGSLSNAADLLARRTRDIKNLVLTLENYFSLLGLRFPVCRAQALFTILGYTEDTLTGMIAVQLTTANVSSASIENMLKLQGKGDHEDDDTAVREEKRNDGKRLAKAIASLSQARASLESNILSHFQRQLSKYIRVVDIPKLAEFLSEGKDKRSRKSSNFKRSKEVATDSNTYAVGPTVAAANGQVFEPATTPQQQTQQFQGHGAHNTMHPDKTILQIFAVDVRHDSPLWAQLDAGNDNSSLGGGSLADQSMLFDDAQAGLDSLDEVSEAFVATLVKAGDFMYEEGGTGSGLDPSVLLAIELANAHKKQQGEEVS